MKPVGLTYGSKIYDKNCGRYNPAKKTLPLERIITRKLNFGKLEVWLPPRESLMGGPM